MVCIPESPPEEATGSGGAFGRAVERAKKVAVALFGIFLLGVLMAVFINWANDYFSRDQTVDVYMGGDWLVGENRICSLSFKFDANGKPTDNLDSLQCPVGNEALQPHNIAVIFKGVVKPKDAFGNSRTVADQWRCTRGSDRFTCIPIATPVRQ